MKDLIATGWRRHLLDAVADSFAAQFRIAGLALDASSNNLYTVLHTHPSDAGSASFHVLRLHLDGSKGSEASTVASFDLIAIPQADSSSSEEPDLIVPQVRSFCFLSDGGSAAEGEPALCIITAGGDIVLLPLCSPEKSQGKVFSTQPEIVGSVEQGILAAAWSPDEESLVLVVPAEDQQSAVKVQEQKLLLMSREFEVLNEKRVQSHVKGTDQVSVGWGSKATQFHGSLGKSAAVSQSAAEYSKDAERASQNQPLQDDDYLPHISWRGDCSFFVVSSLESDGDAGWRRMIRTFDRSASLTATNDESERSLSHAVAMKPVGNIYATSQRSGSRPGRHDVIFFERNGLRRNHFSLREEEGAILDGKASNAPEAPFQDADIRARESQSAWQRDHKLVDMKWNRDGDYLAIHLRRTDGDVLQLWTSNNWHWYLKQDITSGSRIVNWMWDPSKPVDIILALAATGHSRSGSIELWTFCHDIQRQEITLGSSSSSVAVTDGSVQRITFFDRQTIPPPMCSVVLPTDPSAVWRCALPSDAISNEQDKVSLGGWTARDKAWAELSVLCPDKKTVVNLLALLHPDGRQIQLHAFTATSPRSSPQHHSLGQISIQEGSDQIRGRSVALQLQSDSQSLIKISTAVLGESDAGRSVIVGSFDWEIGEQLDASPLKAVTGWSASRLPRQTCSLRSVLLTDPSEDRSKCFMWHDETGALGRVGISDPKRAVKAHFSGFCPSIRVVSGQSVQQKKAIAIGLTEGGSLQACEIGDDEEEVNGSSTSRNVELALSASSFIVSGPFLIWTNTMHESCYLSLSTLPTILASGVNKNSVLLSSDRRVERGSQIVTAVPRQMALILQMPRGNLERIFPRPLVLAQVRHELDMGRYRSAFLHCRTHRVDLNLLCDHNPEKFAQDVKEFILQVKEVDHLNLFLSALKSEDVTLSTYPPLTPGLPKPNKSGGPEKVNRLCDAFVSGLTALQEDQRYLNTILTAHVKKVPADYESALSLLRDLKASQPTLVDSAIEYVIFLAPFDSLFDVALGMYDLTLALMVAQHSKKKDPREYLPFLREIRAVESEEMRHFQIDDHLRRHGKALSWLARAGDAEHERAMHYMNKYRLFSEGLRAWSSNPAKWKQAQELYGDYMLERQRWSDAAVAFELAGNIDKALHALQTAGSWQEAFALALADRSSSRSIQALASSMATRLEDTARYAEAGRVKLEYGRDVEGALESYGKAQDISECRRICSAYNRLDLIETHVLPAALQVQEHALEDIRETSQQLEKQIARLTELRQKKEEQPAAFYGEHDPAFDNIDVQSDTSTQITQFTRYTKAPSHANTLSSLSATSKGTGKKAERRLKKKEEKKKASGKKNSVYEEDYLYESLQRLLKDRLGGIQDVVAKLLPNLMVLGPSHRQAAIALRDALSDLEAEARKAADMLDGWAQEAGVAADEARIAALTSSIPANPTSSLLELLAGTTWMDKAAQRKKLEVAEKKWRSEILDTLTDSSP